MYSDSDLKSLHGFIRATGEGNLKKMLVGGTMTEDHFRALLKVARAVNEEEWVKHWQAGSFPRVKFTPQEVAIKESLYEVWGKCGEKFGLLSPAANQKKAA